MKRVTNKTAWNIYSEVGPTAWEDWTITGRGKGLEPWDREKTNIIYNRKIAEALEPYTDEQIQKVVAGLKDGTQWEASYLKDIILPKVKSRLREIKLNSLGI